MESASVVGVDVQGLGDVSAVSRFESGIFPFYGNAIINVNKRFEALLAQVQHQHLNSVTAMERSSTLDSPALLASSRRWICQVCLDWLVYL